MHYHGGPWEREKTTWPFKSHSPIKAAVAHRPRGQRIFPALSPVVRPPKVDRVGDRRRKTLESINQGDRAPKDGGLSTREGTG